MGVADTKGSTMKTEFDPETHEYKIGGRVVPSVTQILTETLGNPFGWLQDREWYMQRGTAVHAYAAMIARGQEFEPPDERIAGKVAAIRKFFKDCVFAAAYVEHRVFCERFQFGGTFDLCAHSRGQDYLIDWKSSSDIERTRLQLTGYWTAWFNPPFPVLGLEVVLKDDSTYRVSDPLELKTASREFLALRTCYGIRERLGVLTNTKGE